MICIETIDKMHPPPLRTVCIKTAQVDRCKGGGAKDGGCVGNET